MGPTRIFVLHAIFLGAAIASAAFPCAQSDRPYGGEGRLWFVPDGAPAGVALVLPGLNLRPEKMDDVVRLLADNGIAVLLGSLTGHNGSRESLLFVSPETWLSDFLSLYTIAREEADRLGAPFHFVGHSLGCLVALAAMEGEARVRFDRLVLFAPAVTPRPVANAARLAGKKTIIPSRTPREYRVHDGVPASAYHALLAMVRRLRGSGYRGIDSPALVFIDRKDELVSSQGLLRLTRSRLTRWRVVAVDNGQSRLPRPFHHLIIDEDSAGIEEWRAMREEIVEFLR